MSMTAVLSFLIEDLRDNGIRVPVDDYPGYITFEELLPRYDYARSKVDSVAPIPRSVPIRRLIELGVLVHSVRTGKMGGRKQIRKIAEFEDLNDAINRLNENQERHLVILKSLEALERNAMGILSSVNRLRQGLGLS